MRCETKGQLCASRDELAFLSNALSEVMYGFQRPDFIGTPSPEAARLLNHISDVFEASDPEKEMRLRVDAAEVQLLIDAIKSSMAEFEVSEFDTRIGCTIDDAQQLLRCLEQAQRPAPDSR